MKNTKTNLKNHGEMEGTMMRHKHERRKRKHKLPMVYKIIYTISGILMAVACTLYGMAAVHTVENGGMQKINLSWDPSTFPYVISATPEPTVEVVTTPVPEKNPVWGESAAYAEGLEPEPTPYVIPTESSTLRYQYTDEEYENLLRCVEAEVTGDDPANVPSYPSGRGMTLQELLECKIRVAQVILNRVESPRFPNDINGVIFQKNAFSPVDDGRFYDVTVTDLTRRACDMALTLHTHDYTYDPITGERAYFFQMYYCSPNKYGDLLFTDPAGHEYYSYR